jgi:hypothetical protein
MAVFCAVLLDRSTEFAFSSTWHDFPPENFITQSLVISLGRVQSDRCPESIWILHLVTVEQRSE